MLTQLSREALGKDPEVWRELGLLFEAAVPSLERRSFIPADQDQEGASGLLIAKHAASLQVDLERLNDLVGIARNILTIGEVAQNLASESQFDNEVFKLMSVCVKVTARGYDGEAGSAEEDKWQGVVNDYKRLLITCLKFLNNLTAKNETRKLMLWFELFDSAIDGNARPPPVDAAVAAGADLWDDIDDIARHALVAPEENVAQPSTDVVPAKAAQQPASSPFLLYIGRAGMDVKRDLTEQGLKAGATDIAAECKRRWESMPTDEKNEWNLLYTELISKYRNEAASPDAFKAVIDQYAKNDENVAALARSISQLQIEVDRIKKSLPAIAEAALAEEDTQRLEDTYQRLLQETAARDISRDLLTSLKDHPSYMPLTTDASDPSPAGDGDYRMTYDAAYGADILQHGKDDLMRRLETFPDRAQPPPAPTSVPTAAPAPAPAPAQAQAPPPAQSEALQPPPPGEELPPVSPGSERVEDGSREISEEEDSEDDDYAVPGDDGRGLLTDVPLILGPQEIEVLPMIIMSGIVPPGEGQPGHGETPEEVKAIKKLHTVRCHILLGQDNGRNLLRELLIFVAAWDLREEELYFKFMVKIMEAILNNGLMPFSYHAFRETKDIISPAQAVIMKLLTSIFRTRQLQHPVHPSLPPNKKSAIPKTDTSYPTKVEVHMVNFLLTEFRRHIIPQTCALIFLQGQIRAGHASADDFPLNLWDMERMYEGLYQYLEFFAILTEHDVWKKMMAEWEVTSELVTLLKELEAAIPKRQMPGVGSVNARNDAPRPAGQPRSPAPVAVDRPFDVNAPILGSASTTDAAVQTRNPPLTSPDDPAYDNLLPTPYVDSSAEDPADFEWRNLKKLTILVLSSLVYHSPNVQTQVRNHQGIEAILNCCNFDEHNPYIREHAIMCLRFLLEGNKENQDVVNELVPRGTVPNEVLDAQGYETFMDQRGQVGLRRKDAVLRAPAASSSPSPAGPSTSYNIPPANDSQAQTRFLKSLEKKDPRELEALVQQVMRDLPARVPTAPRADNGGERAAVAKLDRGFEGRGEGR